MPCSTSAGLNFALNPACPSFVLIFVAISSLRLAAIQPTKNPACANGARAGCPVVPPCFGGLRPTALERAITGATGSTYPRPLGRFSGLPPGRLRRNRTGRGSQRLPHL